MNNKKIAELLNDKEFMGKVGTIDYEKYLNDH